MARECLPSCGRHEAANPWRHVLVRRCRRFVHGDLRRANIMAKVDRENRSLLTELLLIDLDWSGEAGKGR